MATQKQILTREMGRLEEATRRADIVARLVQSNGKGYRNSDEVLEVAQSIADGHQATLAYIQKPSLAPTAVPSLRIVALTILAAVRIQRGIAGSRWYGTRHDQNVGPASLVSYIGPEQD